MRRGRSEGWAPTFRFNTYLKPRDAVQTMSVPVVTIVGRPNVGKSTLFNRIVGQRKAIVSPVPGVTRDRNIEHADWNGRRFLLVDTGGFEPHSPEPLTKLMRM